MWLVRFFFLIGQVIGYFIDEKYRDVSVDVEFVEDDHKNVYISFGLGGYTYSSVIHMEKIQRLGRNSYTTYNAVYTKKQQRPDQSDIPTIKDALEDIAGWFIRENSTGMLSGVLLDNEKIIHIKPKQFLFPNSKSDELIAFIADSDFPEYVCKPLEPSADILGCEEPLEDNRGYFEKAGDYFKNKSENENTSKEEGISSKIKRFIPQGMRRLIFWWDPVNTGEDAENNEDSSYDAFNPPETLEERHARKRRLAIRREIEALRKKERENCGECTAQEILRKKQRGIEQSGSKKILNALEQLKEAIIEDPTKDTETIFEEEELEGISSELEDLTSSDIEYEEYSSETIEDLLDSKTELEKMEENTREEYDNYTDKELSETHSIKPMATEILFSKETNWSSRTGSIYNETSDDYINYSSSKVDTFKHGVIDVPTICGQIDKNLVICSNVIEKVVEDKTFLESNIRHIENPEIVNNKNLALRDANLKNNSKLEKSKEIETNAVDDAIKNNQNKENTENESPTPHLNKKRPERKQENNAKGKKYANLKRRKAIPKNNSRLMQDKKDRVIGNTFVTTRIPKAGKTVKKGEIVLMSIPYYSQIMKIESEIQQNSTYGFPIEKKAIPVAVAIDKNYIQKLGSKREAIFSVLENMNIASRIYERSFNVLLYVSDIIIDSSAEWFNSKDSLMKKLDQFRKYRQKKKKKCMVYHIATATTQKALQIGLAWRGTIGYNSSRNISASIYTENQFVTMAHEIGHNLGLLHDCDADTCKASDRVTYQCNPCDGCDCKGKYIMNARKAPNLMSFSPPTLREMSIILANLDVEMPKVEDVTMPYPVCGNGIVEQGEECDAGPFGDACCTPDCKLRMGAICSDYNSGCCKGCKPAKKGTICKKSQNECHKSSMCDGITSKCPSVDFLPNNSKCSVGFCASGICTNRDRQCVLAGDKFSIISSIPGYNGCAMKCVNKKGHAVMIPSMSFRDGTPCGWSGTCVHGRCTKDLALAAFAVLAFLIGLLLVGILLI
ncbi:hypothetical protein NEPAR04_1120 [Nematocida parisii]|nr:hypothetical protein NEPAR08_0936 [Nematocida parisii]KAI5127841.1 hypothetical protein NEPAR03_1121 [Nematocida parisii]KAI5141643.1 hypothetical protein NEPAR04_1120 [Nematocida parisii]